MKVRLSLSPNITLRKGKTTKNSESEEKERGEVKKAMIAFLFFYIGLFGAFKLKEDCLT